MSDFTILVSARSFGKIVPEPMKKLQENGFSIVECREGKDLDHDRLHEALETADAWIVSFYPITRALLDKTKKLKAIVKHGVGMDNIDIEAATACGIVVANAPGSTEHSVPELTIGMLFCLARRIHEAHSDVMAGRWNRFPGTGLYGKTLGIIGLGRIGINVARKSAGFGCRLLGYDPYITDPDVPNLAIVPLSQVYAESDFICVCAPLNEETEHLLNKDAFQQMKNHVIIVNTARGKIVDEHDIYEALLAEKVGGYATDVFEKEPPDGNPLLTHPNVLCAPHMGSYTLDSLRLIGERASQGVLDALNGTIPEFLVNKEVVQIGG